MTDPHRYGPWALVAGGSEGVGSAFAMQLAADGFNLVLLARKPVPLEETAAACRALGVQVRPLAVDLTDPGAVAKVVAETDDVEVGLLIYNAGANTHSLEFLDGDLDAFGEVVTLNVTTMTALVHHYGNAMRGRRRGGIVLVGSMASYLGSTRHTVYGGVKAFSRIFAESLWLELREHGVDVVELVLGVTRTPAMARAGLDFEVPGMKVADPADVAREGLANIANGPVHIAAGNDEYLAMRTHPDRAKVVLGAHEFISKLMGLDRKR
ncbi:MAG: SDR family NAD(P)-dependent oxidoreductase [Propionibacteriales bacterium]|nr:SDR family NAD(P)-dependent oxidoreductase [Propionibacteriales bacterium]